MAGPLTRPGETHGASPIAVVQTITPGAGTGDVVGPASSVKYAIPFYDDTTGKLLGYLVGCPRTDVDGNLLIDPDDIQAGILFGSTSSAGVYQQIASPFAVLFTNSVGPYTFAGTAAGSLQCHEFYNNVNGAAILKLVGVNPAANEVSITQAATGAAPTISATGGDTNIGLSLKAKGTSPVLIYSDGAAIVDQAGTHYICIFLNAASAVNYLRIIPGATGVNPQLDLAGTDANIGLNITTEGTGKLQVNGVDVVTTATLDAAIATKLKTVSRILYLENPTSTDSIPMCYVGDAVTIIAIRSFVDSGTVSFNIEQRGKFTPGTAGTDCMTADQAADDTGEERTSSFADATVPADNWLHYAASATTGSPTKLWVSLEYTID